MRIRRISVGLIAVAALLSACGGGSGGAKSGEDSGGRTATMDGVKDGGTLYVLTVQEGASTLDPQRVYTGAELGAWGSTFTRTLTTYKPVEGKDGTALVPDMATDLGTASDDLKTWSFTMRDGVTWEDGSDVTCADIAYGVSRTFAAEVTAGEGPMYALSYLDIPEGDSDFGSAYPGPWLADADQQALFDEAVSCDGKTITFKLKVPVADFNYTVGLLAFAPVPKDKDTADQYGLGPVSNGPFKVESYEEGKEMVLVRNENWNKDSDPVREPHVDKIVWQFGVEEAVIDERMIADAGDDKNTIVYGGILPENLQAVFGDDQFKDRRTDGFDGFVSYTMFNVEKVNCVEMRKAIWLALNREALRTAAGGPFTGEFAKSFVAPLLAADYEPAKLVDGLNEDGTPNVEAATAMLDKAKEACPDVYERATGEGLRFDHPDSATWQKNIAIWIDSLKAIGVNIIDNPIEPSKYYATINGDRGDMMRAGWAADWANASTVIPELFGDGGGFNYHSNENDPAFAEFQAKVDEAKAETDRAKQSKMWKELNQYVMDQAWSIPGSATKSQNLVGSNVRGAFQWLPFGWYNLGGIGLAG
ncbi:MAG: ABC transporter substrate-binding protein [Actinomycetota bacterium]